MTRLSRLLLQLALSALAFFALPAAAQDFPALSGRVVDAANIIAPENEAALDGRLAQLEAQSQRQLVVATVPDLQGYDIADYGYRLGRQWALGDAERDDGVLLLVAPNERRVHIAVGYGLEPILTDALSARIIRDTITPAFREGDFDRGIAAGVDAIANQISLPPEEAQRVAAEAESSGASGGEAVLILVWLFIGFIVLMLVIGSASGGKRHRTRGRHGGGAPIIIWGDGGGSDWGGGSSWGGGFSGGGGSFGGGGASGGW